jgi:EAL domain-containing protein (putative c-di-GMP-specific phosphodiesterase class I)/CheY-like chemotaxis protein
MVDGNRKDTATFEAAALTAAGRRSVLVVDDEEVLTRAMTRVLEARGYRVKTAHDGNAAIQLIRREPFDVIVSDIQMPGMTGIDLLRIVRAYDLDVPVILMTGAPTVETAIEAVSLGALQYLSKPTPGDELVKAVERASRLHRVATMKREALALGGGGDTQVGDRAGLEARFEHALETMWIAFQPIVEPARRRVFGYEALLRAAEPSLPHPGAILDAAERLDRLPEVGRRVRSLAALAFERAPANSQFFINLHTRDLLDDTLYAADAPLVDFADRVVLEITERSAIDDVKDIKARVFALRSRGFRIAVDDLGAGYAGLSSFAALEPEVVKLDMSLVRGAHKSAIRRRLIASMTTVCLEMGMQVVAEGVETVEERDCVLECGCNLLQGYLFAKPGPPFPAAELVHARETA